MDFIFDIIVFLAFGCSLIGLLYSIYLFFRIRKNNIEIFENLQKLEEENFVNKFKIKKDIQVDPNIYFSNKKELNEFILKIKEAEKNSLTKKEIEFYNDFIIKLEKYNFNYGGEQK
ncbi:hypothetical protein [Fusobacterium vincentii]|uniref:hypothetical protein n=1 Tax=Fusobacterium vincentii TaxID=155615 RepID=UPI0030D45A7B